MKTMMIGLATLAALGAGAANADAQMNRRHHQRHCDLCVEVPHWEMRQVRKIVGYRNEMRTVTTYEDQQITEYEERQITEYVDQTVYEERWVVRNVPVGRKVVGYDHCGNPIWKTCYEQRRVCERVPVCRRVAVTRCVRVPVTRCVRVPVTREVCERVPVYDTVCEKVYAPYYVCANF
ncbi:MAG: hypothetical protein HYY17_15410 [Planctomycetes bacterium]|nr:hypothetical protein [Planctomycetota bacterium]